MIKKMLVSPSFLILSMSVSLYMVTLWNVNRVFAQSLPIPCMITFDSDRDGNREIYLMGPDGKDPVNLTNNPADDFSPVWSPDGSHIAFVSNRDSDRGKGQFIYSMSADGSDWIQLTSEGYCNNPDWSQDGKSIAYEANDDIFIISVEGDSVPINLTNSSEKDSQPIWSPDNTQIAWLSSLDGNQNLFVKDLKNNTIRQLSEDGKVYSASWTIDGQIFANWDNPEKKCFNCVMDADGSNIHDAGGKGEIQRYLPFWTLDGNRVEVAVLDNLTGDNEICLVSEIFPDIFLNLTNNPADDKNPDWPPACYQN